MPQATSTEYGNSLFNVHMLKKKNQVIMYRNLVLRKVILLSLCLKANFVVLMYVVIFENTRCQIHLQAECHRSKG